jgi:hypothetical protein
LIVPRSKLAINSIVENDKLSLSHRKRASIHRRLRLTFPDSRFYGNLPEAFGGGPQVDFLALWMGANLPTRRLDCMFRRWGAAEPRLQLATEALLEADGAEANVADSEELSA